MNGLKAWIPAAVYERDGAILVDWHPRGDPNFDGATYDDVVRRAMPEPFDPANARTTTFEELEAVAEAEPSLPLSGVVAHMSRCGSTLISRMLAAAGARSVAEARPIDNVLRLSGTLEERARRLRAIVRIFGRSATLAEKYYTIRLDPWNTADLPVWKLAYPEVPLIFSYRDPLEVLISNLRQQSIVMAIVRAPAVLGMAIQDAIALSPAEYCARVLAKLMGEALDAGIVGERLVDYAELPEATIARIAPLFGITLDDASRAAMRAVTSVHAKRPNETFAPDDESKRASADAGLVALVDRDLRPLYDRLERLRAG